MENLFDKLQAMWSAYNDYRVLKEELDNHIEPISKRYLRAVAKDCSMPGHADYPEDLRSAAVHIAYNEDDVVRSHWSYDRTENAFSFYVESNDWDGRFDEFIFRLPVAYVQDPNLLNEMESQIERRITAAKAEKAEQDRLKAEQDRFDKIKKAVQEYADFVGVPVHQLLVTTVEDINQQRGVVKP